VSENKIDTVKTQNLSTDCQYCIWALKDKEGNQKGCLAGRLDRFREAGAWVGKESPEDTHCQIDRICNLHRTEEWSHYDEDFEEATLFDKDDLYLTKATDEIKTTFGIVIYDGDETHENLEQTIDSIRHTKYDKTKIQIVIAATGRKKNIYEYLRIVDSLKGDGFNIELILNSAVSPKSLIDFEAFDTCVSSAYFAVCNSGATIVTSTLSRIEACLNGRVEKVMTFSQNSLFGKVDFIMKTVVRSEYLKYNDFHKMLIEVKKLSSENKMHRDL
jgi:hypothetical protein